MQIFGFESHGGPEVAGYLDVPVPRADPGTVLVEFVAAGVNPADIKVRSGARQGAFPVRFPMAMGREAAGVVLEQGTADEYDTRGRLVFGSCAPGTGALGEYALLDAPSVTEVPDGLDSSAAACIPVAVGTAYDAVTELDLQQGERLLVLGAGGGVGAHAIQLGLLAGAKVAGVASAGKREMVERLGARHFASSEGWFETVRSEFGEVDAVIDCVGGDTLRAGAALLAEDMGEGRRIRSLADRGTAGELGGSGVERRRTAAVFSSIAQLAASGRLEIVVSDVMGWNEAADAVRAVEEGHAAGKTVVAGPRAAGAGVVLGARKG